MTATNAPIEQAPTSERAAADLKARLQASVAEATPGTLARLTTALAAVDFEVTGAPARGLLMMNVAASDGTVFHLGEVLVTEASVECRGRHGFGCVLGDAPEAALALACLDALSQPETGDLLTEEIRAAVAEIHRRVANVRDREGRATALTRVDFRSMAEE